MTHYQKIKTGENMAWLKKAKDDQNRLHGKSNGKTCYGHKIESQAGGFDRHVIAGRFTIEDMAANVMFITDKKAIKRVQQHLFAKLRDILNIDIQADGKGRIYAACNATSLENNKAVNKAEKAKIEAGKLASVRHIKAKARQAAIDKKIAKKA